MPARGRIQMKTHETDGSLHELVEIQLKRADLRYTSGRRSIVEVLASSEHPLNISDISEQLPDVPRSSAYRHLADLQNAGIIRRIAASDEFARFELSEVFTEHHHHLLCTICGRVFDVTPSESFELMVGKVVEDLSHRLGFRPTSHSLDVVGHCAECE